MALKDGTTSKNMLSRGLTSLLDSGKNKASLAAGPAAAAAAKTPCYWRTERPPKTCCPEAWRPFWILLDSVKNKAIAAAGPAAAAAPAAAASGAAGAGAASLQNAPFATPKHHATEGRNDLQKHAAPRLDVPSRFW